MIPFRLAILISHPVQYYVPLFKLLAEKTAIELKVFYTLGKINDSVDQGFGKEIIWDIPLLDGYDYEFLHNRAKKKGSYHFAGISNPDLINKVSYFKPDGIMIYGWAYSSHLRAIRYFKNRVPIWFRGDSTLIDKQSFIRGALKKFFLKWVYRQIDLAFYTGSHNKAYFKHYGLREEKLIFTPHAIDNERFAEDRSVEAKRLRSLLGIPENNLLILFAGKLETKKDPQLLLDAFILMNRTNTHLLFVGNGDLEESLKDKVESLSFDYAQVDNVQNNQEIREKEEKRSRNEKKGNSKLKVHFMDFQNQTQMPVIYQACDLFCLPSKGPNETWGLAVNEAMAAGKAILVSDKVGCGADLIKEKKNGYTFKAGNQDELIEKLKILTDRPRLLEQMGAASAILSGDWTLLRQVEIILNVINRAKK